MSKPLRVIRTAALVAGLLVAGTSGAPAQSVLSAAKALYAAASYEEALAMLNRITRASPELTRQADEYRVFCLYALGRIRDAESVAESMIRRRPLASLEGPDVSPRLEQMFADVRRRMLPELIHDRVHLAREALDRERFATAEARASEARQMISSALEIGVTDETLADANDSIDGLVQEIRTATDQHERSAVPLATGVAPLVAAAAAPIRPRFYSAADQDVVPPVAIAQTMPVVPREALMIADAWKVSGLLRVLIDESGGVTDVSIDFALDSSIEARVIETARQWRYQPATKNGVPVRYLKTIELIP